MSATLKVDLGARSYPIHIGAGLLDDAALLPGLVKSGQVVIITNTIVGPLYLERVTRHFADRQCHVFELPDGEGAKSFANFERALGFMLERRIERGATIVALGGGVVGDLAGFVAACYQRGIGFVQVPTTLLAQVDSSVGGKTAINHALGKNMVGAFHQPTAVVADITTLDTLPPREFSAGLAEVVKYGLIRDYAFLEWLEAHLDALVAREPAALTEAILRSCENKAEVVAGDEFETGARATLNLGHTFGHAIETALGYGAWLHGEAVAAGTCMAAAMSARLGWLDADAVARIERLLGRAGLPLRPPAGLGPAQFMDVMARDKKNVGGHIRLVLLRALGEAVVTRDYPPEALAATLAAATTAA
ncbi:MAG: 3-dehydroquinate synthase [Gammaproteobacteria bacterium]|nr:3-dehydroquinate synthase [Gammaproteobacteria bacterium]MCP5200750.1 3-dehydroquinate synthase [Gammaproteobacteria bacterium]